MEKKKLTQEQKRLIIKKRKFNKNVVVTTARKHHVNTLLTMRKDFYGMLKSHITKLEIKSKETSIPLENKIQEAIKLMPLQHKNVFRRSISKEEHSIEKIQAHMRLIHKYAQSCCNKNIFTINQVSNLMHSINNTYNAILSKTTYNKV